MGELPPPDAPRPDAALPGGPQPGGEGPQPASGVPQPADPGPAAGRQRRAHPLELGTMGLVVAVDQVTKALVRRELALGDSRTVIPDFLDLTHVHNSGAAFGLLNAVDFAYKPAVMIGVAAAALVAIGSYATQLGFHERSARLGLALILGGALGNLIDRAVFGFVVDFVDVYRGTVHFWAFNVADAAITVGAILVLLEMVGVGRSRARGPA